MAVSARGKMASQGEDGERNEDLRTKGTCRTFEATLKTQLVGAGEMAP